METNYAIQWIDFYSVDSAIQRLNNQGQLFEPMNTGPKYTVSFLYG